MSEAMTPQEIDAALEEIRARDAEWDVGMPDDPLPHLFIKPRAEVVSPREWGVADRRTLLRLVRELLPDARRYRWMRSRNHIKIVPDILSREESLYRSDGLGQSLDILVDFHLEQSGKARESLHKSEVALAAIDRAMGEG